VIGALAGAAFALAALLGLTRRARPLEFLLTGFLLAALFSGASALVTAVAQERPLLGRALVMLGLGDLASAGWPELRVAAPLVLGALAGATLRHRDLDLLALGADEARSLGLAVPSARAALVAWIACGTAASVILGGQLAFVGLLAPHLARRLVGGRHAALLPLTALVGGLVVLASDRLAVSLVRLVSVPTGAITTLAGAPFFFALLRRRSGGPDALR
jgi:iron complex transport system permease protein